MVATIGLCCWLSSAFAQPYASIFGEDSTRMSILVDFPDNIASIDYVSKQRDTVNRHGKTYVPFVNTEYRRDTMYVREDLETGRVWTAHRSYPDDEAEYLLMDMSLAVGDTFFALNPRYPRHGNLYDKILVKEVFTDERGKQIVLDRSIASAGFIDTLTFMEGIGSNAGIHQLRDADMLLCAWKDGIQAYQTPVLDTACTYSVVSIEPPASSLPARAYLRDDALMVSLPSSGRYTITAWALTGQTLFERDMQVEAGETALDLATLPLLPALLYLQIRQQGGQSVVVKMMNQ